MERKTAYERLGLEPGASRAEIRAAYLRLAKKHHPDKNPGDRASEWIFKEVKQAYDCLGGGQNVPGRAADRTGPVPDPTWGSERDQNQRAREQAEREQQERAERARREQAQREERERRERERRARAERARREQEQAERTERERWEQEQARVARERWERTQAQRVHREQQTERPEGERRRGTRDRRLTFRVYAAAAAIVGIATASYVLLGPEDLRERDTQSIRVEAPRNAAQPTEVEPRTPGPDDVWTVGPWPGDSRPTMVLISVNGKVTHGDRLRIRFVAGRCDMANVFTTFYAMPSREAEESMLAWKDEYVGAILDGRSVHAKVLYVLPFLSGVRAFIDLGWVTREEMRTALDGKRVTALSLVDDEHGDQYVQPSRYFDVSSNTWALTGIWDAWREAEVKCRALTVEGG